MEFVLIIIVVVIISVVSAAAKKKPKSSGQEPPARPVMSDIQKAFMMVSESFDATPVAPSVVAPPAQESGEGRSPLEGRLSVEAQPSLQGRSSVEAQPSLQGRSSVEGRSPLEGRSIDGRSRQGGSMQGGSLQGRAFESGLLAEMAPPVYEELTNLSADLKASKGSLDETGEDVLIMPPVIHSHPKALHLKLFENQSDVIKAIIYSEILPRRNH